MTMTSRLLKLLSLLQTRREWPGPLLAARLEVSDRTVRRDVGRLREMGYNIEAAMGPDGGYRLTAGAELPPLLFDDDQTVSMPARVEFAPDDGGRIRVDVEVPDADAVVLHLDWRPATTGIAPALPERNLKERAYWVDPDVVEQPAFTWVLGTDVSIGPRGAPRAVDLRQDGRIAIHAWAPRAAVSVTDTPRPAVSDSTP